MSEIIELGNIKIYVNRKNIKNVHLSVHPPNGKVTLSAPTDTRLEVARAYATTKLRWIRQQQEVLREQARLSPRTYINRESHYLWGRRYLLSIIEEDRKPYVSLDHKRINLHVRPGSPSEKRAEVMREWHISLLHDFIPPIIKKWESRIGVTVSAYYLQRMKTKWGSCNHKRGNIRLNTELVKKPKDLVEYVIVHELIHLLEPTHNDRFIELIYEYYPSWKEARIELNELPLSAEEWKE